ncbi:hypothetical protein FDECE_10730 [Fusarium decemcellulare]|nr:hypothetical protein FDECE_10730 [Fusarium decemcellulare]
MIAHIVLVQGGEKPYSDPKPQTALFEYGWLGSHHHGQNRHFTSLRLLHIATSILRQPAEIVAVLAEQLDIESAFNPVLGTQCLSYILFDKRMCRLALMAGHLWLSL